MPLHYLDTSAAVPLFIEEETSNRMEALVLALDSDALVVSRWIVPEFASALGLKLRRGELREEVALGAFARWTEFLDSVQLLPVSDAVFDRAADYCRRFGLGLRAGDALHLASAAAAGAILITLDKRLAGAAAEVGVPIASLPA